MSEAPPPNLREHGFQILEEDLRFLMNAFATVLQRLGEPGLAAALPWVGGDESRQPNRSLGQAYSIAFQLLNIVEERAASQTRRLREKLHGPASEKGLWAHNLRRLGAAGLGEAEILAVLREVCVEPVVTAHPTEAKRETVRELHREIYSLMNRHENPAYTPRELNRIESQLQTQLENLWRTGEIQVTRPTIEAELQNALYYLREVFPEALARAHAHLREAWIAAGYNPASLDSLPPLLRFGSWIGGDRDGHPFVTADVTRHALLAMRNNALRVQRRGLESLAHHLPLSSLFQATPARLAALTESLASSLQEEPHSDVAYILQRNREEPWRAAVFLMRAKVVLAIEKPSSPAAYVQPTELLGHLDTLSETLVEVGADAIVDEQIIPLRRTLSAFGFHSAALDVRQNSAFHERALDQLLRAAGLLPSGSFADWSPGEKRALLDRELLSPRPFLAPGMSAGGDADTVIACHQVLAEHRKRFGSAGLGSLIVSMTRSVEDLLVVYLLAREAGLMEWGPEGLVCPVPVVPLFETMADLEAGPEIVDAFLAHPITKRSLLACAGDNQPGFQVMVGYSDSNKDCGIVASQCALHRGQTELAATIEKHGARPIFFHGRGGTVGRGAGPTHWFMEALPHGSLHGAMRMTEQGETIAQKYAHIGSAVYNAELLMASATAATASHRKTRSQEQPDLGGLLEQLANTSRDAYRALLHSPDFIHFYRQATPIDALENARIGSRPARRTGQASLDDLRAIPWVFSWTQSRFYLPGWYGAGSALRALKENGSNGFNALGAALPSSPFLRYVLTNIESSLVSANTDLMGAYAGLVQNEAVRHRFLEIILAEFEETRILIEELFQGPFAERRPRLAYTLEIREAPLRVLHHQQVALLRDWRQLQASGQNEAAEALIPDLLISINAIASGLRTTG
ncbi:MAG: phosphoenolpyruvate carboxylase [Verrucomicrobia bacterium]|nr:MAG: phosphoenolpyruvate carboxylase [Verrucomicrobiota bacterium]